MYLAIEDGARRLKTSGYFRISLVDTTTDGAYLDICSGERRERLWVFRGSWFTKRQHEEHLEIFQNNGSSTIVVLRVESHRVLLRIVTRAEGRRKEKTETFWLFKRG